MAEQPFHTHVVQAVALVRHALHDARLAEPSAAARMLVLPPPMSLPMSSVKSLGRLCFRCVIGDIWRVVGCSARPRPSRGFVLKRLEKGIHVL